MKAQNISNVRKPLFKNKTDHSSYMITEDGKLEKVEIEKSDMIISEDDECLEPTYWSYNQDVDNNHKEE